MTMTQELSSKIIKSLREYYGDVTPDLEFTNLYELTISVVLSAQTTDKQVNSVTPDLFKKYPDFKSMASAKISDVEKIIKSVGFFRTKAKNIVNLSKGIVQKFNGAPPPDLDQLTTLPGIGRKSANIILSFGYRIPAMAVDTHVLRLSNRLGYANTDDPHKAEKALTAVIPQKNWIEAHLLLIRHGRRICKAQRPLCNQCPVYDLCESEDKIIFLEP